jgi:hypothetical protein
LVVLVRGLGTLSRDLFEPARQALVTLVFSEEHFCQSWSGRRITAARFFIGIPLLHDFPENLPHTFRVMRQSIQAALISFMQ